MVTKERPNQAHAADAGKTRASDGTAFGDGNTGVETMRELAIPPETACDNHATEMIRVWLAHEDVHVSLLLGMWEDAADCDDDERETWGNLLADVTRHIANGLRQSHGWKEEETIRKIKEAFLENLSSEHSSIEGKYLE